MAKKSDAIIVDGVVEKVLPNATFQVKLESGRMVMAHVSGKMRMHYVRLLPGDRVAVELTPYDLKRGRIVVRYRT